jgi:hypothetical protein
VTKLYDAVFGAVAGDRLDQMLVKESDFHQLILWLAYQLHKSRRPALQQREFVDKVRQVFFNSDSEPCSDETAIQFMLDECLHDAKQEPRSRAEAQAAVDRPVPRQPAAFRRLAQLVGLGLLARTQRTVQQELSLMPFPSIAIFTPDHEEKLKREGVSVRLAKFPIDEEGFKIQAIAKIKSAGLNAPDEDRSVLLLNEGDKGVGMQMVGRFERNDFAGFYIGVAGDGISRYSVATPGCGRVGEKCDAMPCKDLPLSWFIENGVPCPFINAARVDSEANIKLFRSDMFLYDWNGKILVCIPMGFKRNTEDKEFAAWKYQHSAAHGRNMTY